MSGGGPKQEKQHFGLGRASRLDTLYYYHDAYNLYNGSYLPQRAVPNSNGRGKYPDGRAYIRRMYDS